MKNNRRLAEIVAERLSVRMEKEIVDAIALLTKEVLEENGLWGNDDTWDIAMDVASRIHIEAK